MERGYCTKTLPQVQYQRLIWYSAYIMINNTTISQSFELDCTPEVAFHAWLDSKEHGEMLASPGEATIDSRVGGEFSIWDGAITGKTTAIDADKQIIEQDWRYDYDDWSAALPSKLVIEFAPHGESHTMVKIMQTHVPEQHLKDITTGWEEYYWKPMKAHFSSTK